jgi:hypothetical protein
MFILGCVVGFIAAGVLVAAVVAGTILSDKYKVTKVNKA